MISSLNFGKSSKTCTKLQVFDQRTTFLSDAGKVQLRQRESQDYSNSLTAILITASNWLSSVTVLPRYSPGPPAIANKQDPECQSAQVEPIALVVRIHTFNQNIQANEMVKHHFKSVQKHTLSENANHDPQRETDNTND